MIRKTALAAGLLLALGLMAPAIAHGPSGSAEENPDGTFDNQVTCGSGTDVGGLATVYAGGNGVEVCNDGGAVPVQGRVIATTDQGGYVAGDGDADNPNEQTQGWARVDGSGVRCGDTTGPLDATHPGAADGQDDCG